MNYFDKIIASETSLKIFTTLFDNYSCLRCILKFFLIDQHDIYRDRNLFFELLHNVSEKLGLQTNLIEDYDFTNLIKKKPAPTAIEEENKTGITNTLQPAKIQNNFITNDSLREIISDQSNTCRTCLGVLQQADNKEFLNQLLQQIQNDHFEFNEFKLSIRIPLSIYIRFQWQIALIHHLVQKQQELSLSGFEELFKINKEENLDLKVIFRAIILPYLQQELKSQCNMNNDTYTINIELANPADETNQFSYFVNSLMSQNEIRHQNKKKKIKFNPQENSQNCCQPSQARIDQLSKFSNADFLSYIHNRPLPPVTPNSTWYYWSWRTQIYLEGRYLKLNRNLCQTLWIIEGKRLYPTSVEEEIARIVSPFCKAQAFKFHSGGREDIDVRMLGKGRPFALELINPRVSLSLTKEQIKQFEEDINKSQNIQVRDLILSDIKCFDNLLKAQDQKLKAYCCVIYCSRQLTGPDIESINNSPQFTIDQKTPIRVLHRRSLLTRPKIIYSMHISHLSQQKFFKLFLLSQAGTYIKEFIHGDLQRTTPNFGTLVNAEADILQLDVIEVFEKSENQEDDEIEQAIKSFKTMIQNLEKLEDSVVN